MNRPTFEMLTWSTLTAAVISACLLAAGESGLPAWRFAAPLDSAAPTRAGARPARAAQPSEASAAGPQRQAGMATTAASANPGTTTPR